MNFPYQEKHENSAYLQLLMLCGYALAGILICSIIGFIVLYFLYGEGVLMDMSALTAGDGKYLNGLKVFQILSSIGLFLAPPLFLALTERKKISEFYEFNRPTLPLLGLVFLIMVVTMPFTEWTAIWNQQMHFPEFLKPVELWMKAKEAEAMRMTYIFLKINGIGDFFFNLLTIALVPAFAEELMFRGGVQRAFKRMFDNPHVAIWLAAFIFSAIHLQFYGFLPRLLLGALFGYLYLWTGSLWYAILAHFINNAYAVCIAWYLQANNLPLNQAESTLNTPWYGYVISLLAGVYLLIYFKNKANYGKQLG
ncbi:membrane protease YdiL (CAAX protease family) [Pedobacter sp. CAN_A7]|uniref:CPBP family intramembrane glutamic endopeptidase n=1 Tax=Pedobacter sp. CAN_A7 TaxID=2787722 RepID=UPI0018CBD64D